ncbi:MAG TPA: YlxR family protein [Dehalococcoidia bacterium]|jgi:predicted RNA-binding protein YlxR (DUF448 family)|nr:YlxR family protein [Dehalococcoidia bacterium]
MADKAPRKAPQRTCVSCRSTGDKRALVRIVRGPEGVEVDPSGKKPGRGAYLCHQRECWQQAIRKGRLDAALKTRLTQDEKLRLTQFVTTLNAVAV